ncbi:MAG: hypothetical protein WBC19_10925 [Pyrinomonadaceae bacterium]|nr:hypothetical protein [Chloracidobacterium sp.]
MKELISRSFLLVLPVLIFCITVTAQRSDEKGSAVVWQDGDTATIEATVTAQLVPGSQVGIKIYREESKVSKLIANKENVADCDPAPATGDICKIVTADGKLQFRYRTAVGLGTAKYELGYFISDVKRGDIGQMIRVNEMFAKDKPEVRTLYKSERQEEFRTKIDGRPNGEIKVTVQLAQAFDTLSPEAQEYVEGRIREMYLWLDPKTVSPDGVATIRVEPQSQAIPRNEPIVYKVVAMRLAPTGARQMEGGHMIDIILVTDKNFPVGKYDLEVVFAKDAPRELAGRLLNTQTGTSIKKADMVTALTDKNMGLRELKTNLDLALSYTSSVENVKVGTRIVRQRTNNGVLDLRFAPLLNYHRDADQANFFTPFFIDAKISTGKIGQKNLALNRVLIGTEYTRRWRPRKADGSGGENVYAFIFRGINASDRDFKRAEFKANFEFRPWIYALNNPLTARYVEPFPDSVLIESNGKKRIPCCSFGYQIQPIVGVEAGRIYRSRPVGFDIESSQTNIRRAYVGIDMLFNLTKYMNLKVTDFFYVRGETPLHRTRNYFYSEVQAPLMISPTTSQSLFFSFESGQQPPFATPAVNTFKFGYRITSNLFGINP